MQPKQGSLRLMKRIITFIEPNRTKMKKILLTLTALAFAGVSFAGNYVDYWPNGQKKSEGSYNSAVNINENDSKEVKAQKLANAYKIGKWTFWYQNGQLAAEQEYTSEGKMTGLWKGWYQNGNLELEINFTTGDAKFYHMNGQMESSGKMLDGMLKDGKWVVYHDNGKMNVEGSYIKGQKDGLWIFYDRDGKQTATENWKNGALVN